MSRIILETDSMVLADALKLLSLDRIGALMFQIQDIVQSELFCLLSRYVMDPVIKLQILTVYGAYALDCQ